MPVQGLEGPNTRVKKPTKRYKPVALKVKPTSERLPEDYRVVRKRPADCMAGLPELPEKPPAWRPTSAHLSQERMDGFRLDDGDFLQAEE
ncbi:hypothetical protein AURDEDRAFT_69208, partial [Auricularia subglabra TFB-10046 SS5]